MYEGQGGRQPGPGVPPGPPAPPPGYGYGYPQQMGMGGGMRAMGMRRQYPIETKPFFLTSEFAAILLAIIALGITAATSATIDAWRFWILTTALISFYVLSRGIAKSGTRSMAPDPRENLEFGRGSSGRDGS